METKLLLPNRCKIIGIIILIIGVALWILDDHYPGLLTLDISWWQSFTGQNPLVPIGKTDMAFTIYTIFLISGGVMICFAREKNEDEFITRLRLSSWMWAILINYILLIIATITVYGLDFLEVIFYNIFTPLFIFILRFNFLLFRYSRRNEK